MSPVPDVCVSRAGADLPREEHLHSVPCKFHYTGPANVEGYFVSEAHPENGEWRRCSLRGRGLEGARVAPPDGYALYLLANRHNAARTVWEPVSEAADVMQWEWDRQPGGQSSTARALDYLRVAAVLAGDSDDEEEEKEKGKAEEKENKG